MNETNISSTVLKRLAGELETLTPEAQKAARYVLENPQDVGVSTVREIAEAAQVKPNTFVRMARQVGFEGYEDFRTPFRDAIRNGTASFPDRARWLQEASERGALGHLYADFIGSALRNIEETFANISEQDLKAAADAIWNCDHVFTMGVGVNNANARNFTYLASTGMVQFHAIPTAGSNAIDDLAMADSDDVLIAMSVKPYRREVVETIAVAKELGMTVIGITDSLASPVALKADHAFVVSTDTPQFFPSSVSIITLLESLLSFVIARGSGEIVKRVERFHKRRHELGIYFEDPQ